MLPRPPSGGTLRKINTSQPPHSSLNLKQAERLTGEQRTSFKVERPGLMRYQPALKPSEPLLPLKMWIVMTAACLLQLYFKGEMGCDSFFVNFDNQLTLTELSN